MFAALVVLCILGVLCVGLLGFILLTLQAQIDKFSPIRMHGEAPWPIIPESVRIDKVPAVQRKPRKPRAKKEPAAEPTPAADTQTLPLLGADDAQKPAV
jgi:hypothetical protein